MIMQNVLEINFLDLKLCHFYIKHFNNMKIKKYLVLTEII